MNLSELITFCTVAQAKSLSNAADRLNISVGTASRHIRRLETSLGFRLVHKGTRPLRLTVRGEGVAVTAQPLLDALERLSISEPTPDSMRPITIAVPLILSLNVLVPAIRSFHTQFPEIQVHIKSGLKLEILEMLTEGTADVGIADRQLPRQFTFRSLGSRARVLITTLEHPLAAARSLSLNQIARYSLIIYKPPDQISSPIETWMRQYGQLQTRVAAVVDSVSKVKVLVKNGLGIAILPGFAVDAEDSFALNCVSLPQLFPPDEFGVIALRTYPLSPMVASLVNLLTTDSKAENEGSANEAPSL